MVERLCASLVVGLIHDQGDQTEFVTKSPKMWPYPFIHIFFVGKGSPSILSTFVILKNVEVNICPPNLVTLLMTNLLE
jgi:hypothetical protein